MGLLARGNTKLGRLIFSFSVEAIENCPGSTSLCRSLCYAVGGNHNWASVRRMHRRNAAALKRGAFISRMIKEIRSKQAQVIRIWASGDFADRDSIASWLSIVQACPQVTFYVYTRSYRVPKLVRSLIRLGGQPNVQMYWSADRETGRPLPPAGIRTCYLSVDDDDEPTYKVDLVFLGISVKRSANGWVVITARSAQSRPESTTRSR